jgi:hypothetical protein
LGLRVLGVAVGGGKAVIPAAQLLFSILARAQANYLGNVRGVLFRITLILKSSNTGAAYLDRRNIASGPQRLGERLCSQPEHPGEVRTPVWV